MERLDSVSGNRETIFDQEYTVSRMEICIESCVPKSGNTRHGTATLTQSDGALILGEYTPVAWRPIGDLLGS
jgi:hypothetical protein